MDAMDINPQIMDLDAGSIPEDPMDYASFTGDFDYQNFDLDYALNEMTRKYTDGRQWQMQGVPFTDILDMNSTIPPMGDIPPLDFRFGPGPISNGDSSSIQMSSPSAISNAESAPARLNKQAASDLAGGKASSKKRLASAAQMRRLLPEPVNDRESKSSSAKKDKARGGTFGPSQTTEALAFPKRSAPRRRTGITGRQNSMSGDFQFGSIATLLEQPPWSPVSLADLPTKEELENYVELYFTKFHPQCSIIHRPTFVLGDCPVVLVLAMAALGACLADFEGSGAMGDVLAEWARRLLLYMIEHNIRYRRSEFYLKAQLLLAIHARLGTDATRFEIVEANRGVSEVCTYENYR